ncbi:MAG TPA: hypothetical protein DDZ88_20000 [Verrucomicrobiales bacterium]|nr:hypothetical protein [Verrucomicrobiales bacterium]
MRIRGFRPCQPDYIAARFDGTDLKKTLGFIRQTALPHLHITIARDESAQMVMERIDTAILEAGMRIGHESLAGLFMRFFESCKTWQLSPAPPALEANVAKLAARLEKLEAALSNNTQPPPATANHSKPSQTSIP